ncbi:hypothetical protein J8L84_08055 [Alteromonas sp. MMG017]|uniref:hypothetical protein n=1 Tax=Alteromonas sp. MMG017 TaxID=2822692 RepID=UPI001B39D400|nr:hypothetical protein [Alteromonas sp. MMG017]MBQ4829227.1 hypothetical protein [Alteromonas sp. MMG017]
MKVFQKVSKARFCINDGDDKSIADEVFARHLDSQDIFEAHLEFASTLIRVGIYQSSKGSVL